MPLQVETITDMVKTSKRRKLTRMSDGKVRLVLIPGLEAARKMGCRKPEQGPTQAVERGGALIDNTGHAASITTW